MKNIMRLYPLHWILIMIIGLVGGYFLGLKCGFSEKGLYWLASTVVQGFGAMIAIVIVLGIRHHAVISEWYKEQYDMIFRIVESCRGLSKEVVDKHFEDMLKELKKLEDKAKTKRLDVLEESDPFFQSVLFLLACSLAILMFIHQLGLWYESDPVGGNIIMAMASVFLVALSIYCLILLTSRIYSAL